MYLKMPLILGIICITGIKIIIFTNNIHNLQNYIVRQTVFKLRILNFVDNL